MTAIACTKVKMVADRKLVIGGDIYVFGTKIKKLKNGDIVGTSGEYEDGEAFVEWYQRNKNREDNKPELEKDSDSAAFEALVLTKEKEILWYNASLSYIKIEAEFFAIGCGAKPVLCLMKIGKDPQEAIEITSSFDNAVSFETDTINLF